MLPAGAQSLDTGLQAVGSVTKLPTTDPRVIAARIINVALGLLAIIMVSLVIYAGFLWMTSGGEKEKVDHAKKYLRNAIIGLVIILSSWAIATFVISRLLQATGAGEGGASGSGAGGAGGLGGGGASSVFQVRSITPSGSIPLRNAEVRFLFTRDVSPSSAASRIHILKANDNTQVAGSITTSGSLVTFVPTAACPAPNETRHCFDSDTDFITKVDNALVSTAGQTLSCGGFGSACQSIFHTGNSVDVSPPTTSIISPLDGQSVSADDMIRVATRATDDSGISYVETNVNGASIGSNTPATSTSVTDFEASVNWDTKGLAPSGYSLQSKAHDVDSNESTSQSTRVMVRPAFCFDGKKDGDETGLDCGGSCGACSGGSCQVNADCASGICMAGKCVEQPIITGFSPPDGRPGTFVTIQGVNFGTMSGKVVFTDGVTATAPPACVNTRTWSDDQIIVQLPEGAKTGPIQITNAISNLSDRTNDTRGPRLDNFVVDNVARPGLCGVNPDHAQVGGQMTLFGGGLGPAPDRVAFDDREVSTFSSWNDASIQLNVPVFSPGHYPVRARVGGVDSNAVDFRIDEKATTGVPTIDRLDPEFGGAGQYVTLSGRNFGTGIGSVMFKDPSTGETGAADVTFPAVCAKNFWQDTSVTIKVPKNIGSLGNTSVKVGTAYQVSLMRQDRVTSNAVPFTVTADQPTPGICAIQPLAGPSGTMITVTGENFTVQAGKVTFSGANKSRVEANIDASKWKNDQIQTAIPSAGTTGPVKVTVGTRTSNGINFEVRNCNEDPTICGTGEICCGHGACSVGGVCPAAVTRAEYAWRTSTGIIPVNPEVVEECNETKPPSPSPWDHRSGGSKACLNSDIVVRFTTKLDPQTVTQSTFLVQACIATSGDPCSKTTPIAGRAGYPQVNAADTNTDYILFRPGSAWAASTTYRVILTTSVKSDSGVSMKEKSECGSKQGYCFRFTTQQTREPCRVGSVSVAPNPFKANALNQTIPYRVSARAAGDICIQLDASSLEWSWDTAGDGRASITNNKNQQPPGNVLDVQTATALAETGDNPVHINVSYRGGQGDPIRGTGLLSINFVPPQVSTYGPGCDAACLNAAIWARFNVAMNSPSLNADTIVLKRCVNENCRVFDQTFDLSGSPISLTETPGAVPGSPLNFLTIEPTHLVGNVPTTYLEPGRFYKVILKGGTNGIQSATRLALTNLNDPDGFVWTFRVKQGTDARCGANQVNVTPGEKIESVIGARQTFVALPIGSPDACNKNGEPLISDQTYQWTTADQKVAQFLNGSGVGLVDATPARSPRCTDHCVNAGSDGVVNKIAACGNGIVETTDRNYCKGGKMPFGDSCTLLPADASGGEECDLGVGKNGPNSTCSNQCLWNPVRSVADGGTCGNGTLEKGEQCDPGKHCFGGANNGKDCTADANICSSNGQCSVAEADGCSVQCQALGAQAGGSTCGNGDVGGYGKTCDYGAVNPGHGCSADCLHEGSTQVTSVCGNGVLEPGESCESVQGKAWPSVGCDPVTCLHTGVDACTRPGQKNCCGDGDVKEPGKDCDDGNHVSGDGCSSRCLAEGASVMYAVPSFCGDGALGTGEMCEAAKNGDGLIDATQLAQITGTQDPDSNGLMTSKLTATYDAKAGQATYGLQCGFKEEAACPNGYGLTTAGCCSVRPSLSANYPPSGAKGVCRNVLVSGSFPMLMDPSSLSDNFIIAQEYPKDCPVGTTQLAPLAQRNWLNRVANWWHHLLSFAGNNAQASVWCVGAVHGAIQVVPDGQGSKAVFVLDSALAANTNYHVVFRGDPDLARNKKRGIRTKQGVAAQADPIDATTGKLTWSFQTGNQICTVNAVTVQDTHPTSTGLFTLANETHGYEAMAQALQNGQVIPLSGTSEYNWNWQSWVSSKTPVFSVGNQKDSSALSAADISSKEKNGSSLIFASVVINQDTINKPSTKGAVIQSSSLATALLCENPWPSRTLAPFTDSENSKSLVAEAPAFANGPFYHFSTAYCMDAGKAGTRDDLPALRLQGVPPNSTDVAHGVLRQYLLTYTDPSLKNDGIGIRVITNPLHLSPTAWYESRGFKGSPQAIQVDGYEAVRDGTTVYVAVADVDNSTAGPVTSTIYLISYNPNAREETVNIFNQLLTNWTFNVNFQADSENVCVDVKNKQYIQDSNVVVCTADWECARLDPTLHCASFKAKLQRDTKRIADFQSFTDSLELAKVKDKDSKYPLLTNGSYLQTISTSRWPSWSAALGSTLGSPPPTDPVNRYLTCGRCATSKTPCIDNSECTNGEKCLAQNQDPNVKGDVGYDPGTCWDEVKRLYLCPTLVNNQPSTVSRIYQYRAVDGGLRYELSTELEGPVASRYQPPLREQVYRCSNTDQLCNPANKTKDNPPQDADCQVLGPDQKTVVANGTCNPTGGSWHYANLCTGQNYGIDNVCGNGVIGPGEVCELGQTSPAACTTSDGKVGTKIQVCNDCKKFVDGPDSTCVANVLCGNGRVDQGEVCDDGVLNGTYGHCRKDCQGIGSYCGDSQISFGEVCDNGNQNGNYCDTLNGCKVGNSCSVDCHGSAPYCGDKVIQSPEQCDGNIDATISAICQSGSNDNMPCTSNTDCPGGTCGGDASHQSCVGVTAGRCAGGTDKNRQSTNGNPCTVDTECPGGRCALYPTQHVRTCIDPGQKNQCTWNGWSICQPKGVCGDGHVDPGEECDDGNTDNNDVCTNQCKKNVCGDGFMQIGVEECDYGIHNGDQCVSDYGSTCNSCSKLCRSVASSGGYCGDGVKNGAEQCDGQASVPTNLTCRALGYDFAEKTVCNQYQAYCQASDGHVLEVYTGCDSNLTAGTCSGGLYRVCSSQPQDQLNLSCLGAIGDSCQKVGGKLVAGQNNAEVDSVLYPTCASLVATKGDKISCANTCTFMGCGRCQDEPGDGKISGQIFDAVYANQPIPNARVTLYLQGTRLGETFADGDGKFSFNTLNVRPECGFYRIIVDYYKDNICTGPKGRGICNGQKWPQGLAGVDEAQNGGYWSFESQTFNLSNFWSQGLKNNKGYIFLAPRVGPNETLVVHTWNGSLQNRYLDAHLVLPPNMGFKAQDENQRTTCLSSGKNCPVVWIACNYGVDKNCNRDIYWGGFQGSKDLDAVPHANLYCFHPDGTENCNTFDTAPETIKFKRGDWGLTGFFSFYIVDFPSPFTASPSYQFYQAVSSTVRIITQDRMYVVSPPTTAPTAQQCKGNDGGKYWLVFREMAATGDILIGGASTGDLMCSGQATPGENAGTFLPTPMQGT